MNNFFLKKNLIYFLLLFIIIIGFYIVKDFGIGIEEHFQRKSGFYWLNYILNLINTDFLSLEVDKKINEINYLNPNLFQIEQVPYYGIIFDLPMAFFETIFKINEPNLYFYLRHVTIFCIFLLSSFFFYKIIFERFNNYYLANLGFILFIFTPRIFGNIFFDNKDILFLSIITITFYYYLKYFKKNSVKNLIYLSIFSSLSTSARIIGFLVPISFISIILLYLINGNDLKKNIKIFFIFVFIYLFALFAHWPYLWSLSYYNFLNFFSPFFQAMNPIVFFNGEFYQSKYLPISYLPLWIILTTPVFILVLFINGFYFKIKRVFLKFINVDKSKIFSKFDLWNSNEECFDLFVLINFLLIVFLYISVDLALLSGWRHFYFLNFFLIYFSCFSLHIIYIKFRNNNKIKYIFSFSCFIFLILMISDIYKYHPFQSSYFNKLVSNQLKKKFEIDTQSLSRVHAVKEILNERNNQVSIGTASWTPLENSRSLIPTKLWEKLNFVGTNFENADFIYTNHYYEVNINYNKKYQIPENFYLYKIFSVDGTRIYSIYKNKKK